MPKVVYVGCLFKLKKYIDDTFAEENITDEEKHIL